MPNNDDDDDDDDDVCMVKLAVFCQLSSAL